MFNIYLISSHRDPKSGSGNDKMPGVSLIRNILESYNSNYLYIPSSPSILDQETGSNKYLHFIFLYCSAILKVLVLILKKRNLRIVFYNFPKAYVFVYLLVLLRGRPRLILADGLNCYCLDKLGSKFFNLFNKIISLPIVDESRFSSHQNKALWMPGLVSNDLSNNLEIKKKYQHRKDYLVYNSVPLEHNGPKVLFEEAEGMEIDILITDTKENFMKISGLKEYHFPKSLKFIGKLEWDNYLNLLESSLGVLLIRDEKIFANKYNFPSKVIEALAKGVPVYSRYPISGLDKSLYIRLSSLNQSINSINEYKEQFSKDFLNKERDKFFSFCHSPPRGDFFL
tara:strand:+ start:230 stop:1249 length:1020 start_codon:yes stop_codon:yes gene_type:complete